MLSVSVRCRQLLKMPWPANIFCIFFLFSFLFLGSCQQEEAKPSKESVMNYFPLRPDNTWTYTRESINEDGQVTHTKTERWKVNSNLFLDLYSVTPAGEDYLGYMAMYLNERGIEDVIGTFISTEYLDLPTDSLILIASDDEDILRKRWIKGGVVNLKSSFGDVECICTKTTFHFDYDQTELYQYFCKNIGIYMMEEQHFYEDDLGNNRLSYTWRYTLTDFKIN